MNKCRCKPDFTCPNCNAENAYKKQCEMLELNQRLRELGVLYEPSKEVKVGWVDEDNEIQDWGDDGAKPFFDPLKEILDKAGLPNWYDSDKNLRCHATQVAELIATMVPKAQCDELEKQVMWQSKMLERAEQVMLEDPVALFKDSVVTFIADYKKGRIK